MELLGLFKDYVFAIILALVLAYVAYQQMVINRDKLRLDLYNKRFDVYTTTLKFYQELISDGVSSETHKSFIEQKEAAKFLFSQNPSIYLLLDELHEKSFKVKAYKENKEFKNSPELYAELVKESNNVVTWSNHAIKELSKKLEPYLNM
ncbi:hypothetical protein [Pseudoalteromonas sp. T1lg10]|uniref:hypothetical protein n=1 Tax=Pseudoalteromonas sp. T1lg10 TaxID=2077093 RepID=UPI000CF74469|nr:hypothetical protein [Pseudoalteromonas sp. T1lg10]